MTLDRTGDIGAIQLDPNRRFFSATHEEILEAHTTDIYFLRTRDILAHTGRLDTPVCADVFNRDGGILCGVREVENLLRGRGVEVLSLNEGDRFDPLEIIMRIRGPYGAFGLYETALLGLLSSSSAWATAASACKQAAGEIPVVCFGARHVHPAVAPVMDTFKDEAEEALRVARGLGDRLYGVRLDTPSERGGVTPDLVREVRHRLDLEGFKHVKIAVSGGVTPARMSAFIQAGADLFGVGGYISGAAPLDMTLDIKEVDGKPLAKRGRLPGCPPNPRLRKIL